MRLALFALARPTFDVPLATETAARAAAALGADLLGDAALLMDADAVEARIAALAQARPDGVLILQASFCDATMAVRIAEAVDAPLAIWAFPEPRTGGRLRLNSFCGLNLAAHALGLRGRRPGWHVGPPDAAPDLAALLAPPRPTVAPRTARDPAPAAAVAALGDLAGPFGLVGRHPDGFDTCAFDEGEIADRYGATVERVPLDAFFAAARAIDAPRVAALRAETAERLAGLDAMDPEPLDKALRSYAALSDLVAAHGLKGLAVRCWPETFTDYGCAVCGAMARVGEEGAPAACEADMLGALTSRLLQALTGGPAMLTDIVDMDAEDDSAVLWHCGLAPLPFRDPDAPAEAALHSNRVKPLLHQFPLKPGRVTLARLSQAFGERALVVGRGEMLRRPMSFTGTSGVVRLDGGTAAARAALIGGGLEHHVSVAYGDAKAGLESVAARLGLPVLDLDEAA